MTAGPASRSIPLSAIRPNELNVFKLDDTLTVIVISDGKDIKVVHDHCPHMGGPLSQGSYDRGANTISCPWHGYLFSAASLALQENPNERIWVKPLAGDKAGDFKTPPYRLREIPFRREGDRIVIEGLPA